MTGSSKAVLVSISPVTAQRCLPPSLLNALSCAITKTCNRSFLPLDAARRPLLGYVVNVTNMDDLDSDDVVLNFMVSLAPLLILFERVH